MTTNLSMQTSTKLDAIALYSTSAEDIADQLAVMRRQESTIYRSVDYLRLNDESPSSSGGGGISSISSGRTATTDIDHPENQEHILSRSIMCHWCYELVDSCNLSRRSVSRAMNLLDRFVSSELQDERESDNTELSILQDKRQYQLAAMTCLYISIKIHDHLELDARLLSQISGGLYPITEILAMEERILEVLQWRVNGVTAEEVVASLLGTLKPEEYGYDIQVMCKLLDACVYQCELAVGEYDLSMLYKPSEVGLAAVLNGLGTLVDGGLMEMKGRYEYVIRLVELLNGEAGGEEEDDVDVDRIWNVQIRLQELLQRSGSSSCCSSGAGNGDNAVEEPKTPPQIKGKKEVNCSSPTSVAVVTARFRSSSV